MKRIGRDIFESKATNLDKNLKKGLHKKIPIIESQKLPKKESFKKLQLPKGFEGWTIREEYQTYKGKQLGAYIYAYKKINGRLHKIYIGKKTRLLK